MTTAEAERVRHLADVLELLDRAPNDPGVGGLLARANGPAPAMNRTSVERFGEIAGFESAVFVPTKAPGAVVIWFPDELGVLARTGAADTIARKLAERSGATFVVLHSDTPPIRTAGRAQEVGLALLRWADSRRTDLAVGGAPVVVGGIGTGGLLAASLALLSSRGLRADLPPIALQVLVCPTMPDVGPARPSDGADFLTARQVSEYWEAYGSECKSAGPANPRDADLGGLPPALLITAGRDPTAPAARTFGDALAACGNEVRTIHFREQLRDFLSLLMIPSSETGFQQIVRALRAVIVRGRI